MVSVNPYRFIDIYNDEYVEEYRGKELYERPPHLFALADAAYQDMKLLNKNSCILISGTVRLHVKFFCCIRKKILQVKVALEKLRHPKLSCVTSLTSPSDRRRSRESRTYCFYPIQFWKVLGMPGQCETTTPVVL